MLSPQIFFWPKKKYITRTKKKNELKEDRELGNVDEIIVVVVMLLLLLLLLIR